MGNELILFFDYRNFLHSVKGYVQCKSAEMLQLKSEEICFGTVVFNAQMATQSGLMEQKEEQF